MDQTLRIRPETGATTEYAGLAFNSACTVNGVSYAMTAAGLVRIGGADDAGQPIYAEIDIGLQDFETSARKRLDVAYAGVRSDDVLVLNVSQQDASYDYPARNFSDQLQQQRFDIGRGLRSNWFGLTIKNSNGADFELADFTVKTADTQRRI